MLQQSFRYHYLRLAGGSVACCVGLLVVGYLPTVRLAGVAGVQAMVAGLAVSLAAGALGAIPVCFVLSQKNCNPTNAILGAMCIRFTVVLFLVASIVFSGIVDRTAFVLWVAISYLVLLLVDTLISVASFHSARGVSG